MHLPSPRGPVSSRVLSALRHGTPIGRGDLAPGRATDVLADEDVQLALWTLYELHYRGFDDVDARREWDADLLGARAGLEEVFERALRSATRDLVAVADEESGEVVAQIRRLVDAADGPDLARFVQRDATREQFRELMVQRSIYTLKESDPTSFLLPRVDGPVKVALAELQYDEYGGGRPERLHATLFARAMEGCGLDSTYGAYIDRASGPTLAVNNAATLFCLHRRLRGAALGHLAAFEATSTLPCRRIASGVQRLDLGEAAWAYFDEHVEADAVHEEVALRSICAPAVAKDPSLRDDLLFGAATCLVLDAAAGSALLSDWQADTRSGTRESDRVPA